MPIKYHLILLISLLLSSSAFAERMYAPICLQERQSKREVTLLGVNHLQKYQPHPNGPIEKLVDKSNFVFFENTALLPTNGVFRSTMTLPAEIYQPVRLERFVHAKDIARLSRLFGTAHTPGTLVPLAYINTFIEAILGTKLGELTGSDDDRGSLGSQMTDARNIESAAYAYASANKIAARDLETVSQMFGLMELAEFKKEIRSILACTQNKACMLAFKAHTEKRFAYFFMDTESSYDTAYQLATIAHGFSRVTLDPRNERMVQRLLTSIPREKSALVVVGAAHIGGPNGLAAKLESAKFTRVKCQP